MESIANSPPLFIATKLHVVKVEVKHAYGILHSTWKQL